MNFIEKLKAFFERKRFKRFIKAMKSIFEAIDKLVPDENENGVPDFLEKDSNEKT